VEQLGRDLAGRLKVAKVNSDQAPDVVARHRVSGIPTLLLYAGGREVSRVVGARSAGQLRRWVTENLP
jgi:thioredoxin 2